MATDPPAIWIDVPFVSQTKEGCGSAAMSMVMQYWAKRAGKSASAQMNAATIQELRASGDDYEVRGRLRAGGTFGDVPFDELYVLGFDRDTELWMRGHPGLLSGQKGNAPLGREYLLANFEVDKMVYRAPFLTFRLGPFLDTGKTYDPSRYFGTPEWMWDSGVQLKIRVLGSFEFVLGYGTDLRSGKDSFFTTVSH